MNPGSVCVSVRASASPHFTLDREKDGSGNDRAPDWDAELPRSRDTGWFGPVPRLSLRTHLVIHLGPHAPMPLQSSRGSCIGEHQKSNRLRNSQVNHHRFVIRVPIARPARATRTKGGSRVCVKKNPRDPSRESRGFPNVLSASAPFLFRKAVNNCSPVQVIFHPR